MNQKVAILHYAGPPIVGGVESTIFHHARLLADKDFQVKIIAGRGESFDSRVDYLCIPEIDSRHPEAQEVSEELARGELTERFYRLKDQLVGLLIKALKGYPVCIVHNALTLHKNLALTAALKLISDQGICRLIGWSHDFAWQDPLYTPSLHPVYPWDLLRTPWQGVDYVAVSEDRRSHLADLFQVEPETIQVIPPGVDAYAFLGLGETVRRLVEKLDLLKADPLLLLPARITRRKNIEFAIRVTAALAVEKTSATLVVTGPPGPHNPKNAAYLDELKGLCEDLDVRERVHFLYEHGGQEPLLLADDAIAQLYRVADVLLFPSKREGFGIPVLEAGLARLPVFAANIPPVHESGGEFIRVFSLEESPERVANQISSHIKEDQAYGLRKRVLRHFTWQALVSDQIIPLLFDST